jgi:hypothetical protein
MHSVWTRGLVLAAAALLAHAVFSAAVAAAMYWGYPHRIYDVRRWHHATDYGELINAFLAQRRSDLVFAGSSVTFGYPWQESVIFSRVVGRGTNVSVIGLSLAGIHNLILCNMEDKHPRQLVIEIPVVAAVRYPDTRFQCERSATSRYYSFAVRHPVGTGWFPFLWDNEAYPKPDEPIKVFAVPDDYFVSTFDRDNFAYQINRTLDKARTVAETVYVLPSPVYLPGVAQVGHDAKAMRDQLDFAVTTCRKVSGVVCLDPSKFYDEPAYFTNMTHLNQRGHRAMGEWLAAILR